MSFSRSALRASEPQRNRQQRQRHVEPMLLGEGSRLGISNVETLVAHHHKFEPASSIRASVTCRQPSSFGMECQALFTVHHRAGLTCFTALASAHGEALVQLCGSLADCHLLRKGAPLAQRLFVTVARISRR